MFIFRKTTKVRSLTVTLLKIDSTTYYLSQHLHTWTPAVNYFHYYLIPWGFCGGFLLVTRVFNLHLLRWRHCEMTSDCLFNNSSINYDLYLPFILQDICGWSFLFARFQYSVDNFVLFLFFSVFKDFSWFT